MFKKSIMVVISLMFFCNQIIFAEDQMGGLGQINYWELLRSSYVMIALLFLSVLGATFVIERWLFFKSIRLSSNKVMLNIKESMKKGSFDDIKKYCDKKITPLTASIKAIVENKDRDRDDMDEILDIVKVQQKTLMERFMVVLGSISAIAPLLGLLGTVTGIIKAFSDLAKSGTGGPAVVAAGVSEALVTTAFGLVIAIPVLYAYNHYNHKIKNIISDIDVNTRLFLFMIKDEKVLEKV